jgi:hypothetical protein
MLYPYSLLNWSLLIASLKWYVSQAFDRIVRADSYELKDRIKTFIQITIGIDLTFI